MVKNKVLKILFILVMVFSIVLINGNITFAAQKESITYNSKPIDDTPKNITSNPLHSYIYSYKTVGGSNKDSILEGSSLNEKYFAFTDAATRDYGVVRNGNSGAMESDNFSVRYKFLHATKYLLQYLNSKEYQSIAGENDADDIKKASEAVELVADNLGTFSGTNANAINEKSWHEDDMVLVRIQDAVQRITGQNKDSLEKSLREEKRKLNAAYDIKTGRSSYSDSSVDINDDYNTKMDYDRAQVEAYYEYYGERYNISNSQQESELKEHWTEVMGGEDAIKDAIDDYDGDNSNTEEDEKTAEEYAKRGERKDPDLDTVFHMPQNLTNVTDKGPSDMIDDADAFVNDPTARTYLETDNLQKFSQTTYGVLLGVGIVIAVIIGMILGIKIMLAPISQKAEAKKMLIPYVVGCFVVFGAFGIWRIAVIIMQEV